MLSHILIKILFTAAYIIESEYIFPIKIIYMYIYIDMIK